MEGYDTRIQEELRICGHPVDLHDLPDIYYYWGDKHLKPIKEECNVPSTDELFSDYMFDCAAHGGAKGPVFLSIGAGNCELEVRLAKRLKAMGLARFCIECLDLNPQMLARGRELATREGVVEHLSFCEEDCNRWTANSEYSSVIANHSLHHVQNLEGVFGEVKDSLHEDGAFIVHDMIGRNGHQLWPEALRAMHRFWQELPKTHKYNHQYKRYERAYENRDYSTGSFEGIRAQDILPLLVEAFHFQLFIGFANIIDVFIGRAFGPNFDRNDAWDTDFIDRVHRYDEQALRTGEIKPTHMMAVMRKHPVDSPLYSRGLSPEYCVRRPGPGDTMRSGKTVIRIRSARRSVTIPAIRSFLGTIPGARATVRYLRRRGRGHFGPQ